MKGEPYVQLGEMVEFVGGGTPSRDVPEYWGGSIPWASVKDLTSQDLAFTTETITEEGLKNSASKLVRPGTVIIASRVGLGKVCINRLPVAINQDLKALVPKNGNIAPRYLMYFLLSQATVLEQTGVGATVKGLKISDLERIKIPFPPLPEQERIVQILDEAEELRRLQERADRRTADLIPAIFHEMFGDPATNPKGWGSDSVERLAIKKEGAIRTGPFGSDLLHSEFGDEGISVLGIDNVVSNEFCWTHPRCITPEKYDLLRRFRVYPGDVLVTIMGTVGHSCVAPEDLPECISTKHLCVITVDRKRVDPMYLWGAFLFDEGVKQQTRSVGGGAIMEGWNSKIIKGLKVRVPPLPLQREFAAQVAEVRALEAQQAESHRRLDDLFASLLHRAFRGEL